MSDLDIMDEVGYSRNGTLMFNYKDSKEGESGSGRGEVKKSKKEKNPSTSFNLEPTEPVSNARALELEPCLGPLSDKIGDASFQSEAGIGDSHKFVTRLAEECLEMGVKFHYSTKVRHKQIYFLKKFLYFLGKELNYFLSGEGPQDGLRLCLWCDY